MIKLNDCQAIAFDAVTAWFRNRRGPVITLGGYAGTGKTTLISHIIDELRPLRVAFCAFTGKAALVLKDKLLLGAYDHCGTIHSLIYKPVGRFKGRMQFERVESIEFDLIVVDEASMVDKRIFEDLSSFGIPILAVGDHGQLPPVSGAFNLMENPDIRLEEIMRQAEDNPIIRLATMARNDGFIHFGEYGPGVRKISKMTALRENLGDGAMVLCGMNKTRININSFIRELYGLSGDPKPGEPVICLKNNRDLEIYNGMVGEIIRFEGSGEFPNMETDHPFFGPVLKSQFGCAKTDIDQAYQFGVELFDFAYCITTHKSQGSEFDKVILIEERMRFLNDENWRRWLYTAVTRAKKELLIISK